MTIGQLDSIEKRDGKRRGTKMPRQCQNGGWGDGEEQKGRRGVDGCFESCIDHVVVVVVGKKREMHNIMTRYK